MALTRATRYIISERVTGVPRRNYERLGFNFRLTHAISSTKEALDPEWSVKALNSAAGEEESDSAKRSSGGLKETVPEIRFAPNKKRGPGDVLKLHVTAKDMLRDGNEPNFGWVPGPRKVTESERAENMRQAMAYQKSRPQIVVHDYDVDPRTGERIESSKQQIHLKALGRSIGSMVPGGNLGSRAARALKIVVDDLGKFRCPPGTPAANQFTDEFGTNCFQPPVSARRALGRMRDWFNDHVAMGRYLQTLEAGYDDPDFASNRRAMEEAAKMRAPQDVFDARLAEQKAAIDNLTSMLGTSTETARNEDLWSILEALSNNGMWDSNWTELFTDASGKRLWDPTKSMQENLVLMDAALRTTYADTLPAGLTPPEQADMANMLVERHMEVMRGFMTGLLHEFHDDPETSRLIKKVEFRDFDPSATGPDGGKLSLYWDTEAMLVPSTGNPADGFALTMQFNPTAVVLRPMLPSDQSGLLLPPGKIRIASTDGVALEGQQWREIERFMRNEMDLERWRNIYANDLSAARHGGAIQQQARHIAYHEMGHLQQYAFIQKRILDQYNENGFIMLGSTMITDPPNMWDNKTWGLAVDQTMQQALPQEYLPEGFPPVGIHAFEGSMLHILSGKYYQGLVEEFWGADGGSGYGPQGIERQTKLNIMLMEGMTELRALQKMGVVDSEIIDQQLEWMNGRSDFPQATPGGGTPSTPPRRPPRTGDTGVDPPDGYPETNGPDAPPGTPPPDDTELSIIPSGITWITDKEADETFAAQGPWDLMERFFIARFGGRPDDKTGGHQEIPRKSIARTWDWPDVSYAQLSAADLDTRFETLRDDLDALLDRRDAGEQLSDDDLARMWLAAKGMAQIADENKRRRNANEAERQRRSDKFERTDAGRYFRPSGMPYKSKRTEDDQTYDEDRARAAMKELEDSIPQRFPDASRAWTRDPEAYGSEQEMNARRKMTRREQDAMTKDMKERNKRYVHGGVDLEEAIKRAAKVREQRGTTAPDDASSPSAPDASPAVEIDQTIIPLMDSIDRSPLKDTVEGYLVEGTDPDGRGFTTIKVVSTGEESDLDYAGTERTKVVVPKGMRGIFQTDPESGDSDRLLLPPGEFELVDTGEGGVRTLVPKTQMSTSDWANARLGDLDGMGRPMSVAEMRERENLRRVLASRAEQPPRTQTTPYSRDSATRVRMARRRNEYDRGFAQEGIEPFNPDARSRDTSNDVNAMDEMRTTIDGMLDQGMAMIERERTASRLPPNFFVDALTEETREFLEGATSSEVADRLVSAVSDWKDGIDRRPVLRYGDKDIRSILDGERRELPTSGLNRELEADLGWPEDAPSGSRPAYGHMTHEVHDDIVDGMLQQADRAGFPAARRAEFYDHSGESPRGPLGFLGEYDVVLRAEASFRTGFGLGDVLRDPALLMRLSENSSLSLAANIAVSRRGPEASAQRIGNFLHAGITADFRGVQMRRQPELAERGGMMVRAAGEFRSADMAIEAAIAGGFQLDEIERIDVPVGTLPWRESGLLVPSDLDLEDGPAAQFLINAGWSDAERQFLMEGLLEGRIVDVKGATLLRQHRAAAERKRAFDRAGLAVRFTNSDGIDLFSRADLTAATDSGARIGRVRNVEEALSIRLQDEIIARQATLQPIVQEGMRSLRDRVTRVIGDRAADAITERIGEAGRRMSTSTPRPTGRAALVQRLLTSQRATALLRRAGLEDDNIEMVQMVGEMAVAFSGGGPAGVGLVIARRAGREGIDYAVRKAVEQGWLDQDQARKIISAADRVAPEGLPDAVNDALSDAADRFVDSDAAARAREIADAVSTRVSEFGLLERLDEARDRIGERMSGRPDTPDPTPQPATWNPFDAPSGMRSRRQSLSRDIPALDGANDNELREMARTLVRDPSSVDQPYWQEIVDIAGDLRLPGGWTGEDGRTIREVFTQEGWRGEQYFSGYEFEIDDAIRVIEESDLSPDDKQKAVENLKITQELAKVVSVAMTTSKPPPRRSDPFGDDGPEEPWVPPTADEVNSQLDEIISRMPDSFLDNLSDTLKANREARAKKERESKVRGEVESELGRLDSRIGYWRLKDEDEILDRTAPVGEATVARRSDPNFEAPDPDPEVVRSLDDLVKLSRDGLVLTDDLTKPEHRAELRSLLLENPKLQEALEQIRERIATRGFYEESENDRSTKSGLDYAGRELVDALIHARGLDAAPTKITSDEIDYLRYAGGLTPVSRGGNTEMARRHVDADGYPIGEGVDGAGVYFAVQGGTERMGLNEHFDASVYAGENGSVIQGVVAPSARFTSPLTMSRQRETYRLEVEVGQPQTYSEGANPLLDLRRELVAAGDTEMVEALDLMVGTASSDGHGEFQNGYAVMALLQGFDGMASYGTGSQDNRVILYNRSAVMVGDSLLSGAEYAELRPWEKLEERAKALAVKHNLPFGLEGEARTQWILDETQRRLEALA